MSVSNYITNVFISFTSYLVIGMCLYIVRWALLKYWVHDPTIRTHIRTKMMLAIIMLLLYGWTISVTSPSNTPKTTDIISKPKGYAYTPTPSVNRAIVDNTIKAKPENDRKQIFNELIDYKSRHESDE